MISSLVAAILISPPTITLVNGSTVKLTGHQALTIVFLTTDCPIANDSQPDLERITKKFNSPNTPIIGIYIDPRLSQKEVEKHKIDYKFSYLQSIDKSHSLVKHLGATTTPEAFVLDKNGQVKYRGRINNMYSDLGVRRKSITEHDLSNAIESVIKGQSPSPSRTKPYGCLIPDLADFDGN